ncbi:MAG: 3-oxoacyl-[acyl-carrier-protein] reductase [Phycisphaerales bacterium]|nr:MAG: 3-oxoacyl-[acyl-carrier-protein] reductase [Phycisphaerales bacterium]
MTTDPRVAVVTGASRGIGKAIAIELANPRTHNRRVALVARTAGALDEVKAEIEALGGHATAHACDVGDRAALAGTIDTIAKDMGRLDILVNNAGITRDNLVLRMSDEEWDDVLRVNLTSAFAATRAAARPMMRGKFGRIVHISSTSGVVGNAGQANYAAAKSGLLGFSKTIARELGSKNITSNVVAPGFIATDMTANLPPDVTEHVQKLQAVRTIGQPQDIAHAVAFLTSDHAGFITGQTLCVDGGMTMV